MLRKITTIGLVISLSLGTSIFLKAQNQMPDFKSGKLGQMSKLHFMEGDWEGSGWMISPNGQKSEFVQTEQVESKLDGLVLVIDGKGVKGNEFIHEALGVITYDPSKNEFIFDAHLIDGRSTKAVGTIEENDFIWGFTAPNNAKIKYAISLDDPLVWHEKGYYSMDGENWNQFFEMTLNKKY